MKKHERVVIISEGPSNAPQGSSLELPQVEIFHPKEGVQIQTRSDGRVVWVNVDGVCVLRITRPPKIVIDDLRVADWKFKPKKKRTVRVINRPRGKA